MPSSDLTFDSYPDDAMCANCGFDWGCHCLDSCPAPATTKFSPVDASLVPNASSAPPLKTYEFPITPELKELLSDTSPDYGKLMEPGCNMVDDTPTYTVYRYSYNKPDEVVMTGVTLEEAQAWCERDDTHGDGWFDGYTAE